MTFHFKFLQANFWVGKGGTFMVGPGRHLASLRHCVLLGVASPDAILSVSTVLTFHVVMVMFQGRLFAHQCALIPDSLAASTAFAANSPIIPASLAVAHQK